MELQELHAVQNVVVQVSCAFERCGPNIEVCACNLGNAVFVVRCWRAMLGLGELLAVQKRVMSLCGQVWFWSFLHLCNFMSFSFLSLPYAVRNGSSPNL